MTTAIDTNVLLDVLAPTVFCEASSQALKRSAAAGLLVICDIVYCELLLHFEQRSDCDEFLDSNGIRVSALTSETHFVASRAWRTHFQRGKKQSRALPDFLIGAHAQTQATRLLSHDRSLYKQLFPDLKVVGPSRS